GSAAGDESDKLQFANGRWGDPGDNWAVPALVGGSGWQFRRHLRRGRSDEGRNQQVRRHHGLPQPIAPSARRSRSTTAFTLVEMLTTVAVLVIVLGLMVSLARDVRTRSAERLTKDLLRRLDVLVAQYRARSLRDVPEELRK